MKKLLFIVVLLVLGLTALCQNNRTIIVEQLLKTDTSYGGQKLIYPVGDSAETTVTKVIVPPGGSTGWHKHDYPVFGYLLQGELSVERKNAAPFVMKSGAAYAEVVGTWHNGTNLGNIDCVLIVVFTGIHGHPVSIKRAAY